MGGVLIKGLRVLALFCGLLFLNLFLHVVAYKYVPVTNTGYMTCMSRRNNVKSVQTWVPLCEMSAQMPLAVVSSEDNLFTKHNGFDWDAIKTAMDINRSNNGKKRPMHGGSTISQQTAKNVFLWNGRSWIRKGLEAGMTVLIELVWGKERIMEVYLNVIEQGPGIYGAEASAQKYFHHSAKQISRDEAALMAAVLPNPIRYKINAPSAYVYKRQARIATLMPKIGKVVYPR